MNGAIIINKNANMTSRDVVNKLTKILKTKKIGHTGTLDSLATGVLVCLIGKYTKLVDLITSYNKEYIVTIKLGIKTDTEDITGRVLSKRKPKKLKKEQIKECLNSFLGEYIEEVPLYSAVHVNGKRLYEYARLNEEVELPKRIVNIEEIELISYENDEIKFRTLVSKGTYIRSLIQSIMEKLDEIGTMSALIRTKQGTFNINDSYLLKDVEEGNYQILKIKNLLPVKICEVNNDNMKYILNGNKLNMNENGYILFQKDEEEIALYYFTKGIGKLKILFV